MMIKSIKAIVLLVFSMTAILLAGGCASQNSADLNQVYEQWKAKVESSRPYLNKRKINQENNAVKIENALQAGTEKLPPASESISELAKDLPTEKVSLSFADVEIATVLRSMARMTGQNILINPGVEGTINTRITDTPWNEAFIGIINSFGLILTREGNILRVMSTEDLKEQVERKTLQLEQEQVSPLVTQVVGIEFSDPDKIAESLKKILTTDKDGKPRGSVSVDVHSRSLIIRDVEENMDKLLNLISELDMPTPQILIEAHIIETTKDTARELGIQWGGMYEEQLEQNRFLNITPGGVNGQVDSVTGENTYNAGVTGTNHTGIGNQGFGVDLPANQIGGINPASIGFMYYNLQGDILDVQLSALQKAGKVNILSRPSITTLDNNEADIESGTKVPYQTVDKEGNIVVEYQDAVLRLLVTPHVISDHLIKLTLEAKKDEVDLSRTVLGNPFIIKKLAKTQLIVENGSTVVIAGLSKEVNSNSNTGVPYLKDLPLLGWLFKTDSRSGDFEDLLIFITPKILSGGIEEKKSAESTPSSAVADASGRP